MSYRITYTVELECVDKQELLDRIGGKENVVLVDTVGTYEGNKFRIAGAKTIPYPEVIDRRQELLPFQEIIIYCKRSDCMASKKVAAGLKLLNIPNVKVYEGGIEEWLDNGLPVENV